MLKSLERAVAEAGRLPPEMQDDIARMMMLYLGIEQPIAEVTPEQEEAALRSREAARLDDFATEEEMRAMWAEYGP